MDFLGGDEVCASNSSKGFLVLESDSYLNLFFKWRYELCSNTIMLAVRQNKKL